MRLNKGLLIYVRPTIAGLAIFFGVLTIIASAPPPATRFVWVKPDGTNQDYNRDNYACLQESQQRVSQSAREGRSAASSSTVQTNDQLYNACMHARGWELQDETIVVQEQRRQKQKELKKEKNQSREIARDGAFIAYDNGTVLDMSTNLMWAAKDNGSYISWSDAKNYCGNYRGGGYIDWRMPTQDELATLYDVNNSRPLPRFPKKSLHIATKLIDITNDKYWASKQPSAYTEDFNFIDGTKGAGLFGVHRALPVRDE